MSACPSCGEQVAEGSRFCASCGARLGDVVAPARERKFVALLFADLVGSTALGEREDPEVVQGLISRTFSRLSEEIERFGGTVDKIMGDAILALFGVPAAHEDDPERAVRAALEMQSVMVTMNHDAEREGRTALGMRIGVEAGEVMVNLERAPDLPDRMVTGDAANTAARLQTSAEPGSVVVGPAAYAATSDVIEYRELPPLVLKGKSEALPAWVAVAVTTRHGERVRLGLEAVLVGRDDELASLKQAYQRAATTGRPSMLTVIGPAGVGKSRLAWELSKFVDGLPVPPSWMRGRCFAYGNRSYSALREAMRARCDVREDDPPGSVRAKVEAATAEVFGEPTFVDEIDALVGGSADRAFLREDLFDAWRRFLERDAERRPLVLLLEDIHWADEGLLDFLDHLADWGQGTILVLTLARPELLDVRPGWGGGKRNHANLYIDPLTEEQNEEMLTALLGAAAPDDLRRLVLERSEGNPLFTEEIVRSLIDRGILRAQQAETWELAASIDDVELPRSVQGVIASRLDGLPNEEKRALQDAAVIGRFFWLGALMHLTGADREAARGLLGRLRVKELLVPREPSAFAGDPEFGFRHVLIRDVAYESLPKADRAVKHGRVAAWIEDVAAGREEEFAEPLATHHAERRRLLIEMSGTAAEREEADRATLRWARVAAERAEGLKETSEAVRWYSTAVEAGRTLGLPPGDLAELLETLGWTQASAGLVAECETNCREALALQEAAGNEADAGRLMTLLGTIAFQNGRDAEAMGLMAQAFALLEPLGDGPDLAFVLTFMSIGVAINEQLEAAEPHLRRALAMARAAEPGAGRHVIHTISLAQVFLTMELAFVGRWEEAEVFVDELDSLARQTGDVAVFLRAKGMTAIVLHDGAPHLDLPRVDAMMAESLDLARKSGRYGDALYTLDGAAIFAMVHGRLDDAEGYLRTTQEWAGAGAEGFVAEATRRLAWVALVRGDLDRAEAVLAEAGPLVVATFGKLVGPIVEAGLAKAHGDIERAADILTTVAAGAPAGPALDLWERLFVEAVVVLTELGRIDEARPLAERIRRIADLRAPVEPVALWAEGLVATDPAEARAAFDRSIAGFTERQQPIDEARVLLALAEVQRALGDDPAPTVERARRLLTDCGAALYLVDANAGNAREGVAPRSPSIE